MLEPGIVRAEDVTKTISAMKERGEPLTLRGIYEAIEQRVSIDDIKRMAMVQGITIICPSSKLWIRVVLTRSDTHL